MGFAAICRCSCMTAYCQCKQNKHCPATSTQLKLLLQQNHCVFSHLNNHLQMSMCSVHMTPAFLIFLTAARHLSKTVSASEKSMPTNCSASFSSGRVWHQLSGPSIMTVRTPSSLACIAGKPEASKGIYISSRQLARPMCSSQETMHSVNLLSCTCRRCHHMLDVLFLCHECGSHLTGESLRVSGLMVSHKIDSWCCTKQACFSVGQCDQCPKASHPQASGCVMSITSHLFKDELLARVACCDEDNDGALQHMPP